MLVAAVVGAAVGAGVALLLAPQSGKATREWLGRGTRPLADRVGVAVEERKDVVPNGVISS
jgi:gas vesicle protein